MTLETEEAIWNVENVVHSNGLYPELSISGWFCIKRAEKVTELSVLVDGDRFPCLAGLLRPDVAAHFKNSDHLQSGFLVRLPASVVKYSIQMVTASGRKQTVDGEISPNDVRSEKGAAGPYIDWLMRKRNILPRV